MSEKPESIPLFQRHIETGFLIDRLDKVKDGEMVSYGDLSRFASVDVQGTRGRGYLKTATKFFLNEHGVRFATVRNVGLKRLTPEEAVTASDADVHVVNRTIRRNRDRLVMSVRDFDVISSDAKVKYNTNRSILEMVNHVTQKKAVKQIETRVRKTETLLPVQKTIEAFRNGL
jgi:hypothetical protein